MFSNEKNKTNLDTELVILENDTLFNINSNIIDLGFLNDTTYGKKFLDKYNAIGFGITGKDYKNGFQLRQWNTPIVIYFDKKIPNEVIKGFKLFFSQISNLEHLNISFTSKIKNANYYIKTTSEEINVYNNDFKFESDTERKKSFLTGATYRLTNDSNNKFYSGILSININRDQTDLDILKQLKQLFFLSLGNFDIGFDINSSSLLSKKYISSDTISEFDYKLIKLHYSTIYPQIIDERAFSKLIKKYKTLQ
ncbi:hypothetical protein [Xanthomarina sp. F2636L]|uniref:hypothetical protein n=1 Tax=Xanthomarina sp. F2636L TaxID=2996018 RepID=UPI00225DFB1A|nr:hypothetical protein [Xanthomarina sp. F2636L]MCX7549797.1 hypothetical protein [Xanthomarina sp. F2636L]